MVLQTTRSIAAALILTCVVAACGSDSDDDAEPSADSVQATAASSDGTDAPTSTVATPVAAAATTVAATTPPTPAPATTLFPPVPRVLLVGDSTLLAVESYEVLHVIRGMDPVYEARSCRALAQPSCGENPAPNSVAVIDSAEGAFDMVVIMAGYDEWYTTFADSFDQVVASSRAKGAKRIVWLSYPEGVDYELPGRHTRQRVVGQHQPDHARQGRQRCLPRRRHRRLVPLQRRSPRAGTRSDDIHLTPTGAHGVADYISRKVAFIAIAALSDAPRAGRSSRGTVPRSGRQWTCRRCRCAVRRLISRHRSRRHHHPLGPHPTVERHLTKTISRT